MVDSGRGDVLNMRVFGHVALICTVTGGILAAGQTPSGPPPPAPTVSSEAALTILSATRKALGGEDKLAAIKSFVATGRTKQIRGANLVPIEFEIACELPDKYVRKDEIPAQESDPSSVGFNGDQLIQIPPPPPMPSMPALPPGAAAPAAEGRPGGPMTPPDPRKARVNTAKQDFAKLTLGMFATSFASYPLVFTVAGQAEAPQGKADILGVSGPGGFAVKLLVNSQTHLPIMVSWTQPPTSVIVTAPGQPPPATVPPGAVIVEGPPMPAATAPQADREKYVKDAADVKKAAQARPVEYRIYYADYRDVGNGVQFPFRLRRAIGADTIEETNFDGFKLNSKIDPKKFGAVK